MKTKSLVRRAQTLTLMSMLLLGLCLVLLSGCGSTSSPGGSAAQGQIPPSGSAQSATQPTQSASADALPAMTYISADDLDQALKDKTGWQLVDIREPREFAAGHIKMALNRPLGSLEKNLGQISKDKEIVLIDLNATRAQAALQVLIKNGYAPQKIKVLAGGMQEWRGIVSAAGNSGGGTPNSGGSTAEAAKPVVQEMVGGC